MVIRYVSVVVGQQKIINFIIILLHDELLKIDWKRERRLKMIDVSFI